MKTFVAIFSLILLISLTSGSFVVSQAKAQGVGDILDQTQVSNNGQWWQINSTSINIMFPSQGQKPMFLWYYNDNSSEVYCVKYRGLIEYLPLNGYYTPDCEAYPQTMQSLMMSEYGGMGGMGGMGMNQIQGTIDGAYEGWVSNFHPSYLPFSACSWSLTDPVQVRDENGSSYVSFNFTLTGPPSGFGFTQNNIIFRCVFYENESLQQPYGLYSYTIGPRQLAMDMSINNWSWNTNYMSSFFSTMHQQYGVTAPAQTGSLALWCDFSSINMQDLNIALDDANEQLTSVPLNSTLAPKGLLESSSTTTDIIAGGHQIRMQNMPESVTNPLGIPTGASAAPYRMQFAEGDKTLPGYFNFVDNAAFINETTNNAYAEQTTASYRTADNYMQLFICYPYFGSNTLIHDPSIGIDTSAQIIPENIPAALLIAAITTVVLITAVCSRRIHRKTE
jgi:hypothetical protein